MRKKIKLRGFCHTVLILIWLIPALNAGLFPGATLRAAQTVVPDLSGAKWLIIGPFPNPARAEGCLGFATDYLTSFQGEAEARPLPGQGKGHLIWRSYQAEQGMIDFQKAFGPVKNAVAYAYTEFNCAIPRPFALKLGSDDGVKLWLNGRVIWQNHIHRSLQVDEDAVIVNPVIGSNRLLVKVDQGDGEWGFAARFRPLDQEKADWRQVKQPGYRFVLTQNIFAANGRGTEEIRGTAVTVPAFAVAEEVIVAAFDGAGRLLYRQKARTGNLLRIPLPKNYVGACRIDLSGTGIHAKVKASSVTAFVGELTKTAREFAAQARQTARSLPVSQQGEDIAATLNFLANQLKGKMHPSLCTPERTIRAIATINELIQRIEINRAAVKSSSGRHQQPNLSAPPLTGVRQWAYRSAIDQSDQPYTLYLPEGYSPARKYSLLVCLHGYSGDDYGAVSQALGGTKPADFIVVAPFGRGDLAYRSLGEQDVLDVMERMTQRYSIDPDRIYLTGWSMGGCGAWRIGQFYADRFAAVAPFCGWTGPDFLANLRNTPVLIVHGDSDHTVPVESDRAAYDQLVDLGYQVRYDELPGVGHDAWGAWTKQGVTAFFDYLRQFRRNPWPDRVTVTAAHLRYGKEYWARIVELAHPWVKGSVSAAIVDERHLRIATENVKVFSLNLRHPKLAQTGRVLLEIDGYGVTADSGQEACMLSFAADQQRFLVSRNKAGNTAVKTGPSLVRHDGGGLADLFTGPLIIAYGSQGGNQVNKQAAGILANWTAAEIFAGTKVGQFRVKPERLLTRADLQSNNLLFLNTDQSISRLFADWYHRSPLDYYSQTVQINGQRFENAGLVMVFPNPAAPSRLLGFISLPYPDADILRFITNLQLRLRLYGLGKDDTASFITPDVIVLGSPDQIKWQGTFDYHWRNLRRIGYN